MPRAIEYKDSLRQPAATSRAAAARLLRNLGLGEDCPAPSNRAKQEDAWSCGLWVMRWIDRKLREIAGELRMKPPSIMDCFNRGNEFISKVKNPKLKDKAVPKAKAEPKTYKNVEPTFANLDEALAAGLKCTKCIQTKLGTKGCRACMGDLFEQIRLKKAKGAWASL